MSYGESPLQRSWEKVVVENQDEIVTAADAVTLIADTLEILVRALRDALTIPTGRQ